MKFDLVVSNATLVDEHGSRDVDIAIVDGRVAELPLRGTIDAAGAVEAIDADGYWVLPGLVDAHVHCRAPDRPDREDFASGTAAAAAGGITTILEMPIADIGVVNATILNSRRELAERDAHVDFGLFGAPGSLDRETVLGLAAAGAVGFKIFTLNVSPARGQAFDGICITDEAEIQRALELVAETGLPCAVHAENDSLLRLGYQRARREQLGGAEAYMTEHPEAAEAMAVAWMGVLAETTGARVHIVHVTSAWALDHVRFAKARGARLTAETCLHYLLFDEQIARQFGVWAKIAPPLRSAANRDALWAGLADGTLDFIASDHAPFLPEERAQVDILEAPSGVPNIEVLGPLMLSAALEGKLDFHRMVGLLSAQPARQYGIYPQKGVLEPGSDADLLIYDPRGELVVDTAGWLSRSRGSARIFDGIRYRGTIVRTIVRGRTVYCDGAITGTPGWGRMVRPIVKPSTKQTANQEPRTKNRIL